MGTFRAFAIFFRSLILGFLYPCSKLMIVFKRVDNVILEEIEI